MGWDDELDQLVTKVHHALTRTIARGRIIDTCGLSGTRAVSDTTEGTQQLAAVDSVSSKADPMAAPGDLRVIDLCGLDLRMRAPSKGKGGF
jgi:hypothetical protein